MAKIDELIDKFPNVGGVLSKLESFEAGAGTISKLSRTLEGVPPEQIETVGQYFSDYIDDINNSTGISETAKFQSINTMFIVSSDMTGDRLAGVATKTQQQLKAKALAKSKVPAAEAVPAKDNLDRLRSEVPGMESSLGRLIESDKSSIIKVMPKLKRALEGVPADKFAVIAEYFSGYIRDINASKIKDKSAAIDQMFIASANMPGAQLADVATKVQQQQAEREAPKIEIDKKEKSVYEKKRK